jgi:penicillin-binding protein 1C
MAGDRPLKRWLCKHKKRLLILGGGLAAISLFFWFSLPRRLFNDPLSAVLLATDGRLLDARLAADEQWRFPRLKSFPDRYFQVLVQYEDRRFFQHPGVDLLAVSRAMAQNLRRQRIVSGGSTISMQVIRIARKNRGRTYLEKIREMFLALRLELSFSKKEILELYAANAPFGGNIVGVDAASWFYFDRSAETLSWAEAAFLAVIPNDPGLISSSRGRQFLQQKRNRLLQLLLDRKCLSELEYSLALAESIPNGPRPVPRLASHLLATLAAQKPGQRLFQTTIDPRLQGTLLQIIGSEGEKLLAKNIRNLAAVIIDNRRGTVAAYAGNILRDRLAEHGQDIDLIKSPRSTGSILKPFLYAAMLHEGGVTPRTLVADTPVHFSGYIPENFDRRFRGEVPARDALAWSLNIPAIRMLQQYGIPRFYNLLKKWGMTTLTRPPGGYGLTLILGGAEGTLYQITCMYAGLVQLALADAGRRDEVRLLADEKPRPLRMRELGPAAAFLTLQALTEVNRPDQEGFWKQFNSSKWVAWKTGTSFGLRDAWSIGMTPAFTIGVWAGNADGEGNPNLTGLSTSAPVLFDILQILDTGGAIQSPNLWLREITVCRDSGFLATDLCPAATVAMPRESHFTQSCPYHQLVHLDGSRRFRVDSRCESIERMVHIPWFVLPPLPEYYYRRYHPEYRALPPFRPDCAALMQSESGRQVMSLVYPEANSAIYLPVDLDGKPGQAVFEAVHRRPETVIYWHIDDKYLTATRQFHQVTVNPGPGQHVLVLIDEDGRRLERRFTVLSHSR